MPRQRLLELRRQLVDDVGGVRRLRAVVQRLYNLQGTTAVLQAASTMKPTAASTETFVSSCADSSSDNGGEVCAVSGLSFSGRTTGSFRLRQANE